MSRLPPLKRIQLDDVKGVPEWFASVLVTLNSFFQSVSSAINGDLRLVDNVKSEIVTVAKRAPLDGTVVKTDLQPVTAVLLGKITGVTPSSPPVLQWHAEQNQIVIDTISGLVSGSPYKVTLILL